MSEASQRDETAHPATIEQLAESFLGELRRGEQPSISDYARKHPRLAPRIRDVFTALAMLERLSPAASDSARDCAVAQTFSRLGEYRILREIGRGGMGVVYEAVHDTLGRHVALKVLPQHLASDVTLVERFHREAKVAARLHHTNIVPVFDVGKHDGVHYYSMQFINGLGLDQVLTEIRRIRRTETHCTDQALSSERSYREHSLLHDIADSLFTAEFTSGVHSGGSQPGSASQSSSANKAGQAARECETPGIQSSTIRLPGETMLSDYSGASQHYFRSVARVGLQVAEAVGYIHSQQHLHRDIKPSNLILDAQGVVWVADLGLARDEESGGLTRSGDIVGTVRYMAPERFRGQILVSSDLYSLGLTLYELLTLRPAFDQVDRGQLIHEITTADPPRPQSLDARIPRDLETIVLKLIDREPERRYQTAREVAVDLRSYLEDRPIQARRAGPLERCWRWCRRNRAVAALLGSVASLLLLLAMGGAAAALVFREQADRLADQASELRREQTQSTRRLYDALAARARSSRLSELVGRRFDSLQALTEAAALGRQLNWQESQRLDLRNEAIACMTLTDVRLAQSVRRTPRGSGVLKFDEELARYVWSTDSGELHLVRTTDHQQLSALPGPGVRAFVAEFSPDGRMLAAKYHDAGPPQVKVWDLETKTPIWESAGDQFPFSPDGRRMAIGHIQPTVEIIDLEQRRVIHTWSAHAKPGFMRYHPVEPRLAVASLHSRDVQIRDEESGKVILTLPHPAPVYKVDWNPAGTALACACTDNRVYLWDAQTGRQEQVLVGHRAEVVGIMFDHIGDLIATHSWDNSTRLWNPHSGRQLLRFDGRPIRFSLDDCRLACASNDISAGDEVRVYDLAAGQECRQLVDLKTGKKSPYHLDVSHDGRLLLSTGPDGVTLWDLATYKPLAFLPERMKGNGGYSSAALFAPDGKSIFTTGADGLRRWPMQSNGQGSAQLVVGPPESVLAKGRVEKATLDRAGQTVALVQDRQGYALRVDRPDQPLRLVGHNNVAHIAISPDGHWIVTGTWKGRGVVTWNAQTGQRINDLFPEAVSATVAMSPDGKWLAAGANEVCRVWEIGSWKLLHEFPAAYSYVMAFSPDSSTLALSQTSQSARLVNLASGQTLALLSVPDDDVTSWMSFTPDGSRLAMAHHDHQIRLWDLARIRRQLGDMGLDWAAPSLPATDVSPVIPITVQVDLGLDASN